MEIPYRKVAIYLLTFLGYIYSGYGSGVLANLRDAVLAAETVFGDVLENIITVANKIRNVHDVFDAAVEEHCVFKCPTGKHECIFLIIVNDFYSSTLGGTPKANRDHVPSSDGCGSLGLNIDSRYLPVGEMTKCCDVHDLCYDTCNKDKELCDLEFKRCLYKYCESYESNIGGVAIAKSMCKL